VIHCFCDGRRAVQCGRPASRSFFRVPNDTASGHTRFAGVRGSGFRCPEALVRQCRPVCLLSIVGPLPSLLEPSAPLASLSILLPCSRSFRRHTPCPGRELGSMHARLLSAPSSTEGELGRSTFSSPSPSEPQAPRRTQGGMSQSP
jgi:hypothetical protein